MSDIFDFISRLANIVYVSAMLVFLKYYYWFV